MTRVARVTKLPNSARLVFGLGSQVVITKHDAVLVTEPGHYKHERFKARVHQCGRSW